MMLSEYFDNYRHFIKKIPGLMIIMDVNSSIIMASNSALKMIGFESNNEITGLTYANMRCKAAEYSEEFLYEDKLVFSGKKNLKLMGYHQYADSWRLTLAEKYPLVENGQLLGLICYMIDVTNSNIIDISQFLFNIQISGRKITRKSFSYIIHEKDNIPYQLSERQLECLFLLLRGCSDKTIAKFLNISHRTVESYVNEIKFKISCQNRSQIIEKSLTEGLFNIFPKRFLAEALSKMPMDTSE